MRIVESRIRKERDRCWSDLHKRMNRRNACVRLLSVYFDDQSKSPIGATSDTECSLFDLTVLTFPFPENGIVVLDHGLPAEAGVDTPKLFSLSLYWVCTLSISIAASSCMFLSFCRITNGFGAWSRVCFRNLSPWLAGV